MSVIKTGAAICKTGVFVTKVGGNAAISAVKGAVGTLGTAAQILNDLGHKDYEGALTRAGNKIASTVCGIGQSLENVATFASDLEENITHDRPLDEVLTSKNAKKLSGAMILGVGAVISVDVADGVLFEGEPDNDLDGSALSFDNSTQLTDFQGHALVADASFFDPNFDSDVEISDEELADNCELPLAAIDNGVFVGDDGDLESLIAAGEYEGTTHIDSENIDRDMAARQAFLEMHGYNDVPQGYEVHHIVPLSEGGADTPQNMILVTEEDHATITAAHRTYYRWG